MYNVNLDLLATTPHHPDGRPRDPHAHHATEQVAALRAQRRAWWGSLLAALRPKAPPALAQPQAQTSPHA